MKLQYQLTRNDLGNYHAYYYWKNKIGDAIVTGLVFGTILLFGLSGDKEFDLEAGLVAVGVGLIAYFLVLHRQLKKYGQNFRENGPMLAKKELELTEEFLISTDEYELTKTKWNAFSKMETGKHAIYLFLDKTTAIIIPNSAFTNPEEKIELINYLNDRIKAVGGKAS